MNTYQTTQSGSAELKNSYQDGGGSVSDELAQRRKKLAMSILGLAPDQEDETEQAEGS